MLYFVHFLASFLFFINYFQALQRKRAERQAYQVTDDCDQDVIDAEEYDCIFAVKTHKNNYRAGTHWDIKNQENNHKTSNIQRKN